MGREYALLLTPKFLSARRRGLTGPGRWGRAAMVLGVGAAAWPFIYVALTRLLRTLRGVEEVGPLLASKLLALGLLMFLGILLLSNLIAALSSFFLSRDLPWIRAAPVDWLSVYLTRLTETLVSSSWMVVLMLVPVLTSVVGAVPVSEPVPAPACPSFPRSVRRASARIVAPEPAASQVLVVVHVEPHREEQELHPGDEQERGEQREHSLGEVEDARSGGGHKSPAKDNGLVVRRH